MILDIDDHRICFLPNGQQVIELILFIGLSYHYKGVGVVLGGDDRSIFVHELSDSCIVNCQRPSVIVWRLHMWTAFRIRAVHLKTFLEAVNIDH